VPDGSGDGTAERSPPAQDSAAIEAKEGSEMAVQQMTGTVGANMVEARRLRRIAVAAIAVAIEAILIVSVVLSTIGASPAWHPTPNGPTNPEPLPAPTVLL
jgi:hypothetical protein